VGLDQAHVQGDQPGHGQGVPAALPMKRGATGAASEAQAPWHGAERTPGVVLVGGGLHLDGVGAGRV
jgi:hypothetical protein